MNKARVSLAASALVAGVFAWWGGWSRRWMSDDGLIVLRTVRNILAGNGPVFNAGERVEANTSTLWQYLIAAFGWVPGVRLEAVALWLALLCTVGGVVVATWASGALWQRAWPGMVAPFGGIIYLSLPPARDFATSGLEWGLSLAWFGVWFAGLVAWARWREVGSGWLLYALAFWGGLSWLVRPELALYGAATGLMLIVVYWRQWKRISLIAAAALPVPAGYELFRMGYYGLLTPHTAVAKSASDSAWGVGAAYVWDTVGTYWLWLPLLLVVGLGVWFGQRLESRELLVVGVVVACGLLHLLYVVRVGGDFMHGRMVLLPLFALLMPVAALPLRALSGLALGVVVVWASIVVYRGHALGFDPFDLEPTDLTIVDEREFWTAIMLREPGDPPHNADDFLGVDLMRNWNATVPQAVEDNVAAFSLVRISENPKEYVWDPFPRVEAETDLLNIPPTIYMTNLGMTGMNVGLDARVLETIGLATPLAARQPRIDEGRIGHDKFLPRYWQYADTAVDPDRLPDGVDKQKLLQARAALRTPEINELLATSREPMSVKRFAKNVKFALTTGRTLELEKDPASYLDEQTLKRIDDGEDVGLHGPQVYWPVRTGG
ncbi:hypothetical protein [Corynebacterium aquatimens]|uniref:Arabinofuranosyltransferase n=1 Tax=Corynebacterium aquatimens TaxID=1190508 RepID=A0A931GTB7_9CORY|nr:hypothetical protein [Corynebacterium aquatimens]MBG6122847.1 arabinofuranosyltransferase [Corynebacterium aquatimens]WJY66818.1 hypothetical protein CAQUA_10660 [Corynebacterium aquatimens]